MGVQNSSTPRYGSWLNMAEIEIEVIVRQFLARPRTDRGIHSEVTPLL